MIEEQFFRDNIVSINKFVPSVSVQDTAQYSAILAFVIAFSFYWQTFVGLIFPNRGDSTLLEYKIVIIVVAIVGLPFLSITFMSGAHIYFAGIARIISLPLVISYWDVVSESVAVRRLFVRGLLVVVTMGGIAGYFQNVNKNVTDLRRHTVDRLEKSQIDRGIWIMLKRLGAKKEKVNYLVYIPKNNQFWSECHPLDLLRVSMLSKRASLYGLGSCSGWYSDNYYSAGNWGFHSYSRELFQDSMLINRTKDDLCRETLRLGFAGFFTIKNQTIIETSCSRV